MSKLLSPKNGRKPKLPSESSQSHSRQSSQSQEVAPFIHQQPGHTPGTEPLEAAAPDTAIHGTAPVHLDEEQDVYADVYENDTEPQAVLAFSGNSSFRSPVMTPDEEALKLVHLRQRLRDAPTSGPLQMEDLSPEARMVEAHYLSLPAAAILGVVRIQRTWRGYRVRRDLDLLHRRCGATYSSLEAMRLLRSVFRMGRQLRHLSGVRTLPTGPFGTYKAFRGDTSATRVRFLPNLKQWCFHTRGDKVRHVVLSVLLLGVTGATYLIPGWLSLCLKLLFYEGHSTLTVDQIVSWILLFTLVCCAGIAMMQIVAVLAQEHFGNRLEFVMSITAKKHAGLFPLDQLNALRNEDVGKAKTALYRYLPYSIMHLLHTVMGTVTILAFDPFLGLFTLGMVAVLFTVVTLYDRLVLTQFKIAEAVRKHEGWQYKTSFRRPSLVEPSGSREAGNAYSRNYHLALSKSLLRLSTTYSRVHGVIGSTGLMLLLTTPIFFFYAGGKQVQAGEMQTHTLVFCIVYFAFTMMSAVRALYFTALVLRARPNVTRAFVVGWHFRDFAEQMTFHDRECRAVRQVHSKHQRVQPRSYGLFLSVVLALVLVLGWILYFTTRFEVNCSSVNVDCSVEVDTTAAVAVTDVRMPYHFDFYEGCTPTRPIAKTLGACAYKALRLQTTPLGSGYRYTATVTYQGWRGTTRGLGKHFYVGSMNGTVNGRGATLVTPCPTLNNAPFRDEYYLRADWPMHGVTGNAYSINYRHVDEIFYRNNRFQGCAAPPRYPEGVCENIPEEDTNRECWCARDKAPLVNLTVENIKTFPCACQPMFSTIEITDCRR